MRTRVLVFSRLRVLNFVLMYAYSSCTRSLVYSSTRKIDYIFRSRRHRSGSRQTSSNDSIAEGPYLYSCTRAVLDYSCTRVPVTATANFGRVGTGVAASHVNFTSGLALRARTGMPSSVFKPPSEPRGCAGCGLCPDRLWRCSCRSLFCSRACQVTSWPSHKVACKRARADAAAAAAR